MQLRLGSLRLSPLAICQFLFSDKVLVPAGEAVPPPAAWVRVGAPFGFGSFTDSNNSDTPLPGEIAGEEQTSCPHSPGAGVFLMLSSQKLPLTIQAPALTQAGGTAFPAGTSTLSTAERVWQKASCVGLKLRLPQA